MTNGTVAQQGRKLRQTGLHREVAGWVVSEGAGLRKPDPAMFRFTVTWPTAFRTRSTFVLRR